MAQALTERYGEHYCSFPLLHDRFFAETVRVAVQGTIDRM
jgi:hypothetical protein